MSRKGLETVSSIPNPAKGEKGFEQSERKSGEAGAPSENTRVFPRAAKEVPS
jgi:hypothetical protein